MPKQSDLIVNPEENKINPKEVLKAKTNSENRVSIPAGHIPIRLSTKGKLSVPAILHFRNFNIEEIIELASIRDDEEKMFILMNCLNNMVAEDINCTDLHETELTELLYYIHTSFNSNEIGPYEYYIDNEIRDSYLKNKKVNIGEISFKAKDLNIENMDNKFKEPITIKKGDKIFKFRLPRIKDEIMAKEYILEKYKNEKEKFLDLEYLLKYNENPNISKKMKINLEEEKEYKQYQKNKLTDYTKILIASVLQGDEKKDYDFEIALQKLLNNEVGLDFWSKYDDVCKNINFGLQDTIKFKCPNSKEIISRRFLFQCFNFLPTMESKSTSEFDISFGD